MKVVACYKCVPEEQDIVVKADHTLDFQRAEWKIGQYDLNAVEAGMRLTKDVDGEMLALTVGGDVVDNSKLKKSILSRGPAQMFAIKDASLAAADSYATAQALKAGLDKIGGVSLVLCGEGSSDVYAQQVGPVLGALLGWPTVNAVSALSMENGALRVERSLEDGIEVLDVTLPAVIAVTTDINMPRIPGMKDIMGAGKKPATVWSLADVSCAVTPGSKTISILAPEQTNRVQIILEGDNEDNIEALYGHLRKIVS